MLAMCYKSYAIGPRMAVRYPILHVPDGLESPRETKVFAIGNRAGKSSIATVQIGNNFAHTVCGKPRFYGKKCNKISARIQQCAWQIGSR